jgi:two-component system, NarL family, nitrate/nitrite response regulator NarL
MNTAPVIPLNVIVADAHPLLRFAIDRIFGDMPGYNLAHEGQTLEEVFEKAQDFGPGVLIFDPKDSGEDWPTSVRALQARNHKLDVIILTPKITVQDTILALEAGVRGVVNKTAAITDLMDALQSIRAGNLWVLDKEVRNIVHTLESLRKRTRFQAPKPSYNLTPREFEIVKCITRGASNKDISRNFSISEETVKRHLSNIFDKTGVGTRLELAIFAIHRKLVPPALAEAA